MSKNPMKQTALDLSPAEENTLKAELIQRNNPSLLELRKQNVERVRQTLDLDRKETNLETVDELNQRIGGLLKDLTDKDLTDRVFGGIETGKDYSEAIKGVQMLAKVRDDMLDRAIDSGAGSGKKKKIAVAFQAQGVQVAMQVTTDE